MDDQSTSYFTDNENASIPLDSLEGIEVVFDQSGRNRSSRDQPDQTFPCPHPGCDVACKRKYERDRHYQTKHVQSKDLFCPIGKCRCSRDVDELAEVLSDVAFWYWSRPAYAWASEREKMKAEVREHRSDNLGVAGEYSKCVLHGFARRDRIIKHIRKAHKEIDTTADDFSIERDALVGDPILAEVQAFWYTFGRGYWGEAWLARLQRADGNWTEWFGIYEAEVAAAGFHPWSKVEDESYELLKKNKGYENVLPWEAGAILQKLKLPTFQESGQVVSHSQVENTNTETSIPHMEASIRTSAEDLQGLPPPLWSTYVATPENSTTPFSRFVLGSDAGGSYPHLPDVSAGALDFSLTPGHSGGSLSTEAGVVTPTYHFGEPVPVINFTAPTTAPAAPAIGAEQEGTLWPGHIGFGDLDYALPALPLDDGGFGTEHLFDFDFNFDFGDFNTLPQWQPEEDASHGVDEPENEEDAYAGLGKRRFSQV